MKNPNGYGCIKHLSGPRRNPWVFVVTENGKQRAKGYFPTKLEALAFQVDWNKSHDRHRLSKITFSELYLHGCIPLSSCRTLSYTLFTIL